MKKLEEYVRSIPDFPEPGIIFRDVTSILQDADGLRLAIDSMQECLKGVDVDVIMGAKDSSGDLENLKAYIRLTQELPKKVAVLAGNDGNILNCLKLGGAGGIAGRANLYPATVASIYDKFVAGDIEGAEAAQASITGIQRAMKLGNPNTVIKLATRMLGNPVGEPRRPFNYLCPEGIEVLKEVLAEDAKMGLH